MFKIYEAICVICAGRATTVRYGTGCDGHQFVIKGLQGCLSTLATPGTVFAVPFLVFDSAAPPANATVSRFVTIVDPCQLGQHYCEHDGLCGVLTCEQRLELQSPVDSAPPAISFLPGAGREVRVAYGEASALRLVPCANYAALSAPAVSAGCWVVAWDAMDGDVSAFVSLELDLVSCGGEDHCIRCAATAAVNGTYTHPNSLIPSTRDQNSQPRHRCLHVTG